LQTTLADHEAGSSPECGAPSDAPEGKRNGNYPHGCRTKEMIEVLR